MKRLSISIFVSLLLTAGVGVCANEAVQRDATLDELQSALGLFVRTTEISLDTPKYARFVLIKKTLEDQETKVLRDMYFPATYFRFLNIADGREVRSGDRKRTIDSIRMTCWNSENRKNPQGWSHTFEDMSLPLERSRGTTSYLASKETLDTSKDIVIWEQVLDRNGVTVSQRLIIRFSEDRWEKR